MTSSGTALNHWVPGGGRERGGYGLELSRVVFLFFCILLENGMDFLPFMRTDMKEKGVSSRSGLSILCTRRAAAVTAEANVGVFCFL